MSDIRQDLSDMYEDELLFADGFDSSIIGVHREPTGATTVVYSTSKMVDACMQEAGLSYEDSVEYLEYNTFSAYVGDKTPIYVDTTFFELGGS